MDRIDLINKLSSLPVPDVDKLIASISGASHYDTSTLPVPSRVSKLIAYAEGATGPGLQMVIDAARLLFPPLFPIDTPSSDSTLPSRVIWNVPHERNDYFTGRDQELSALRVALTADRVAALTQASNSKTQALTGLGGIGKTQTAVEYAYRCRNRVEGYPAYDAILFTRADTLTALLNGYTDIARILQLPLRAPDAPWQAVADVRNWLETNSNWLLLFDNADDPALLDNPQEPLKSFRPKNAPGHILLTSRARHFHPNLHIRQPIQLKSLLPDDAVRFLFDRTERNPDTEEANELNAAADLAHELGYFPLALEQAAAYITVQDKRFGVYLADFRKREQELLAEFPPETGDYYGEDKNEIKTVRTTWTLNFEVIENESPASAQLLSLSAFLAPDAIPSELIVQGAGEIGSPLADVFTPLQKDTEFENAYDKLLEPLLRYSLIEKDRGASTYSVHRMVQSVQRNRLKEKQAEWAERTVRAVCLAFPNVEFINWPTCASLLPHALANLQHARKWKIETGEVTLLRSRVGYFLGECGFYAYAALLFEETLTIQRRTPVEGNLYIATILNNLAELYRNQGHYEKAEPLYVEALEIYRKVLPQEYPHIARGLNNLALLYEDQARYAEAEQLFVEALDIHRKAFPQGHPDIAQGLNNLAALYDSQGRYTEAEPLFMEALEMRRKALPQGHPSIATSLSNLAGIYDSQGRYEKAEPLFVEALAIDRKALPQGHPSIATSLNNLAAFYDHQCRYEEAEPLHLEALEMRRKALPQGHPSIADSLNNLAELYRCQGRLDEAEPLFVQALEMRRQSLPEGHPHFAQSLNNMAGLYESQRRFGEVEPLYRDALAIMVKALGPQHPHTLKVLNNVVRFLLKRGRKEEAADILEPLGYKLREE